MNRHLIHRVLHGHYPVTYYAPISDYLSWRSCRLCDGVPEPPPQRPYDWDGKPQNLTIIHRDPFTATSSETSPRSAVSRAVSAPDTPQTAHEVAGVSLVSLGAASPGTDGLGLRRHPTPMEQVADDMVAMQIARENREPTDDEIYNGFGMEGGIAYTTDEPGSLGENDWRL